MNLSFSTNAFTRHSVFHAIERIAAIGYDGVEILADIPHCYPFSRRVLAVDRLKELIDRCSIRVANVNANTAVGYYGREFWEPLFEPSLAHPDDDLRRWRIDYTTRCIDLARGLESPSISVTSGRMVPGVAPNHSLELLKESLLRVLDHAERQSVRVGIEYEPGLLVENGDELAELLDAVGSPLLGANLDLGHSHVLGEDPARVIETLAGKVFHIHMEDIKARKHYHLVPGEGDMDFGMLFRTLREHGYDGFVSVELYTYPHEPEAAATRSLNHLRQCVI
ncbi:MAG: sugar phosphate isomerase/epimerase family protein [Syntrophobacteraceae bacterium]